VNKGRRKGDGEERGKVGEEKNEEYREREGKLCTNRSFQNSAPISPDPYADSRYVLRIGTRFGLSECFECFYSYIQRSVLNGVDIRSLSHV